MRENKRLNKRRRKWLRESENELKRVRKKKSRERVKEGWEERRKE